MFAKLSTFKGRLLLGSMLLLISAIATARPPSDDGGTICNQCIKVGWIWVCGPCL